MKGQKILNNNTNYVPTFLRKEFGTMKKVIYDKNKLIRPIFSL